MNLKRKLMNRASEMEDRRASASPEEEDEEDVVDSKESESESGSDGESKESESDEDKRVVKGVLSEKDKSILKKRKADLSRIENLVPYRNKQRTLVFCSRGITSTFRHFMEDLRTLLPHHRKEIKHDTKKKLHEINDVCDMKACNSCIFLEARKNKDLYMWISKTPEGPSVKFQVLNLHTMDELRLSGNCLLGSRPLLSFSNEFESTPALLLIKELFTQIFGTPRGHPKSKPFIDHIMTFSICDGKIWFRHFQITDSTTDPKEIRAALKKGDETTSLVEIGPRFVLNLIKVFGGSFEGRTLVMNPDYLTPTKQRGQIHKAKGNSYRKRKQDEAIRAKRVEENILPEDPIQNVFR